VHSDQTENAHHSSRIVCPCCPGIKPAFKTFALLMKHQSLQHNIQFEQQTLKFDAKDAFIKWKEHEETATNAFYMKNAECESTEGKIEYFECHRSNFTKFVSKPSARAPKISGLIKIDGVCPARLVLSDINQTLPTFLLSTSKLTSVIQKTLNASPFLKMMKNKYIVTQLRAGVSYANIIKNARPLKGNKITGVNLFVKQPRR
jgi:hypothetical protein